MGLTILNQMTFPAGTILAMKGRTPSEMYNHSRKLPCGNKILDLKKEWNINFRVKANPFGEYIFEELDFSKFFEVGSYASPGYAIGLGTSLHNKLIRNSKGAYVTEPMKKFLMCQWFYSKIYFVEGSVLGTNYNYDFLDKYSTQFYTGILMDAINWVDTTNGGYSSNTDINYNVSFKKEAIKIRKRELANSSDPEFYPAYQR